MVRVFVQIRQFETGIEAQNLVCVDDQQIIGAMACQSKSLAPIVSEIDPRPFE